ncbi:hypothetical protein C2W27_14410 [Salmonella enterica]|nr:hypothetical protein [Salmonella enterica]
MPAATSPQISALFGMRPAAALRWLENKGLRIRGNASQMLAADHAIGFGFANLARLDIAQDLVNGLRDMLANGGTARDFENELAPVLKRKGWWGTEEKIDLTTGEITRKQLGNPARLNTIYRTVLQGAQNGGRYESMIANAKNRPYWRYVAVEDAKTRHSHLKLSNRVFHYLDPIWQFIFPPNGFNCRCRVEAMTLAEVQAAGLTVSQTDRVITQQVMTGEDENGLPVFTPVNGVQFTDPDGKQIQFYADVGFDINPGREVWRANLDKYDPELSRPYIRAGLEGPELAQLEQNARAGDVSGELLAAAVLLPQQAARLAVSGRTCWLSDNYLAEQATAKTLPALRELPRVQETIEAATVTARSGDDLLFLRETGPDVWALAELAQGQIVRRFRLIDSDAAAQLLRDVQIIEDAR